MERFQVKVLLGERPPRGLVVVDDSKRLVKTRFEFELLAVGAARLVKVSFESTGQATEIHLTDLRKHLPLGEWGATARELALQEAAAIRRAQLGPRRRATSGAFERPYEEVAARYRELVAAGVKHPGPTIAAECGVDSPTVRNWLRRCRELGLLDPAPGPGKAGEVRSKSSRAGRGTRKSKGRR